MRDVEIPRNWILSKHMVLSYLLTAIIISIIFFMKRVGYKSVEIINATTVITLLCASLLLLIIYQADKKKERQKQQ